MCAKRSKPTTYNKKHVGRNLSATEKKKITMSKVATKNAHNPFDSFTQKRHMNVKGQRSQTVKLSKAHSRDLKTRRDTLLVELKSKDRSNNLKSDNLDDITNKKEADNDVVRHNSHYVDKQQLEMVAKSLRKLQRRDLKRKRFTLNEDSDDDISSLMKKKKESITLGATLGDIDETFDRNMMNLLGDDYNDVDDADVELRNEFAMKANKRLEKLQSLEARNKTDEDRYMEIIRKSKLHKIEKQKAKEEQMDLTDELNEDFRSLMSHLALRRTKNEEEDSAEDEEDDYDKAIRSFAFEPRITPETLKRQEKETAEQRRKRLEMLEKERLERMKAVLSIEKKKESVETLDYEEYLSDNEEDIDSDDEIDPNVKLGVPDDLSTLDNISENNAKKEASNKQNLEESIGTDIPFVIEVPSNHAALKELLDNRTPKEVSIIFSRIRELNDPTLGNESKLNLQKFLSLIIKHFRSYIIQNERNQEISNIDFSMLDTFYSHIFDVAEQLPRHAVSEFRNHLHAMHNDLIEKLTTSKEIGNAHGYPNSADLLFLKLIANIFPVTDFKHPITTPANIYIHQCLADCKIKSLRDIAAALFLCTMAMHYNYEAKRFSPEVITILTKILHTVYATADEEEESNTEEVVRVNWLRLKKKDLNEKSTKTIDFSKFIIRNPQTKDKLSLVRCAISICKKYSEIFGPEFTSYSEAFDELRSTLETIVNSTIRPEHEIYAEITQVIEHIRTTSEKCIAQRKRLLYLDVKPKAIPQFTPLIYGSLKGNIVDTDKIRLRNKTLTQKLKRAQRSAIREIRKDNSFLAKAREEINAAEMKQRKDKYKEIVASLESERREQYQLDFGNRQLAKEMKQARKNRRPANRAAH